MASEASLAPAGRECIWRIRTRREVVFFNWRDAAGKNPLSAYNEPVDYSDALFMASRDHRYADFAESWEFLANVQVFIPRDV